MLQIVMALVLLSIVVTFSCHRIIMSDLSSVKADLAQLTVLAQQAAAVAQAGNDFAARVITAFDAVVAKIGSTGPTQEEIDALHVSAQASIAGFQASLVQSTATNNALQAELAKVTG